jgi:hypothetical protein
MYIASEERSWSLSHGGIVHSITCAVLHDRYLSLEGLSGWLAIGYFLPIHESMENRQPGLGNGAAQVGGWAMQHKLSYSASSQVFRFNETPSSSLLYLVGGNSGLLHLTP